MKNLILKFALVIMVVCGLFSYSLPAMAALDCANPTTTKAQLQCGACGAAGTTGADCQPASSGGTLTQTIKTIIEILSLIIGAVAVIMIIIGGFRYITSAGNPENTKAARNTILYAIVGLVIVALAQIIVFFVLNNVTDTTSNNSPPGGSSGTSGSGAGGPDTSNAR